jgi:peptide/nickel transport system permease protein
VIINMMETVIEEEYEIKEEKEKNTLLSILHWIVTHIRFIFVPGSISEDLERRRFEYEKRISVRKFIRRLKSPLTILGIVIIFTVVSLAVFAPWISFYTFQELTGYPTTGSPWGPPSALHPFGQTINGRDVLGRMIWGARSSLTIALPAILFSVIFGVIIGIIAAYYGGWVDMLLMRIMDIFLAFPGLVLVLVFISIWGYQIVYYMLAYGILGIAGYARLIRGNVLQARELPYIQAARVSGAKSWRIMFRHILPNGIQPIIIAFTFDIGGIILSLAGLSFIGYGSTNLIEWGNDIAVASNRMYNAPWAMFCPGIMILITVLGFMLVGDGLRDALDPRLKNL